ncbi:right-handed parallel beta-helix repeat-containing protein [uncultured Paraglaciecola sp.]|uniref:right-handed parallel beta-helix repeat-containing protein n=1 Tax=uncultured Paraglaciecola sp. TaxID=1765024 RepID=UPI00261AE47D|nr:right-handed parallel beta-helix repeat-containing protein [uncultured Paraglaciecola sp.]
MATLTTGSYTIPSVVTNYGYDVDLAYGSLDPLTEEFTYGTVTVGHLGWNTADNGVVLEITTGRQGTNSGWYSFAVDGVVYLREDATFYELGDRYQWVWPIGTNPFGTTDGIEKDITWKSVADPMGLLFTDDFASGDSSAWQGESGTPAYTGNRLVYLEGTSEGYVYIGRGNGNTGNLLDGMVQGWVKFTLNIPYGSVGGNRNASVVSFINNTSTANIPLDLRLLSDASTGQITRLRAVYDNSTGAQQLVESDEFTSISNDGDHTIEVFFRCAQEGMDDGVLDVYIDGGGTPVFSLTNIDSNINGANSVFDEIRLGIGVSGGFVNAVGYQIDDVEISTNRVYTAGRAAYYIDNVLGDDANTGSSASPMKSLAAGLGSMRAGDVVNLVDNGAANPYRFNAKQGGRVPLTWDGTATSRMHLDGHGAPITGSINATHGGDFSWTESPSQSGEYYVTRTGGANPGFDAEPNFIGIASSFAGMENLTEKRTKGTMGSLAAGEFDYGDNDTLAFNTIYYRPASGETITSDHIEIPYAGNSAAVIDMQGDYLTIQRCKVYYGLHHGIRTNSATGSRIIDNTCKYNNTVGIYQDGGSAEIRENECANQEGTGSGGGIGILNTTVAGNRVDSNYCHGNEDDGIDTSAAGSTTNPIMIINNRCVNNGHNSSDGIGIEINSTTVATIIYNTVSGNNNRGISIANATDNMEVSSNIIDGESVGIHFETNVGSTNTIIAERNTFYGNTSDGNSHWLSNYDSVDDNTTIDPAVSSTGIASNPQGRGAIVASGGGGGGGTKIIGNSIIGG